MTAATRNDAGDLLTAVRRRWEPALLRAVNTLPNAMQHVAGYHLGWWDEDGAPAGATGGKAIRPALTLLTAASIEGRIDSGADPVTAAVPAAVAVELVHNFSLLHDDVMDNDLTRRHRPTTWAVFGVGPAILAGDALLSLAMDVLAASDHPASAPAVRMLSSTVQALVDGQIADLAFERRTDVTLTECLRMAEAKTGALLGCACALGALLGGGSELQVQEMGRFGCQLGLAFQLIDDLLGIWGDPETTGKPVRNDLRCRKKSLPVVAALTSETAAAAKLRTLYFDDAVLSEDELARAADLVEEAGGRAWCQQRADSLLAGALQRLDRIGEGATRDLRAIAELIGRRDH
ncbi:family 2 encapsulin nanocompartment cargo protein polyprenyl transferase [Pseudonocardia sp. TRM90224]|uniref:family 2 encapsulin nanocompartment cargo protein polyprenyl transferase n=1 Tax=Pseudonocardia sp. TRM90224 TaxID=2812678 RepID=UPI001E628C73|nr:family 2 encapsulin nanocompartment cargo protein polyprenyl transferase [Pseudonocardia sp. TRM90224]